MNVIQWALPLSSVMYLMVNVIAKKALVEDNVTNVKPIIGEIPKFWMDVPLAVVIQKAQNLFNVILKLENVSAGKVISNSIFILILKYVIFQSSSIIFRDYFINIEKYISIDYLILYLYF